MVPKPQVIGKIPWDDSCHPLEQRLKHSGEFGAETEQLLELTSPAQHGLAPVLSSTPDLSPSPQSLSGQVFF